MSHITKFGDASRSSAVDVIASPNCGICDTAAAKKLLMRANEFFHQHHAESYRLHMSSEILKDSIIPGKRFC